MKRTFLTARWRWLVMLNYPIDAGLIESLVPAGTDIDFFQGQTFLSLVGFLMLDTRVRGWPIPWHRNFEEVNLRYYVRRNVGGEWRRGVAFIKEIVPRWAIASVARWVYNEPYVALPMSHALVEPSAVVPGQAEYRWNSADQVYRLGATFQGEPRLPAADSEEQFITEHYWGYARQRDGFTVEYEVKHPPWKVWRAVQVILEGDLTALYGHRFGAALRRSPSSAFIADGSVVEVLAGQRLIV